MQRFLSLFLIVLLLSTLTFARTARKASPKAKAGTVSATKKSAKKPTKKNARGKASRGRATTRKASWKRRGQQGISAERAREIQEKLIAAGYLNGEADGVWDSRSQEAIRRLQKENGWQTKIVPDSRALIKLGLGPDHAQALNAPDLGLTAGGGAAEEAMVARPQ